MLVCIWARVCVCVCVPRSEDIHVCVVCVCVGPVPDHALGAQGLCASHVWAAVSSLSTPRAQPAVYGPAHAGVALRRVLLALGALLHCARVRGQEPRQLSELCAADECVLLARPGPVFGPRVHE